MASGYDLSLAPDSRFLKFRENFTTREHFLEVEDLLRTQTALHGAGYAATVSSIHGMAAATTSAMDRVGDQLSDVSWAIEEGLDALSGQIGGLRQGIEDGFHGVQEVFSWGMARLCWEHEQSRAVYREILDLLQHPLQTQALELRRRAERATSNGWWPEAATDLEAALANNPYDYLAQLQLARVQWFEFGHWEPAISHFELAAKYADSNDADDNQRYYAALAYCHVSLLWRMDAETQKGNPSASLEKAAAAAARAQTVTPTLPLALQECVLSLLALGNEGGARGALEAAFRADEGLLLAVERNVEMARHPLVTSFATEWRERHGDLGRAVRQLAADIRQAASPHTSPTTAVSLPPVTVLLGPAQPGPRRESGAASTPEPEHPADHRPRKTAVDALDECVETLRSAQETYSARDHEAVEHHSAASATVTGLQAQLAEEEGEKARILVHGLSTGKLARVAAVVGIGASALLLAVGAAIRAIGGDGWRDWMMWGGWIGGLALFAVANLMVVDRGQRAENRNRAEPIEERASALRHRLAEAQRVRAEAEAQELAARCDLEQFDAAARGLEARLTRLREQLK
jgi:tetratricopeptide (TPR) repeat protein